MLPETSVVSRHHLESSLSLTKTRSTNSEVLGLASSSAINCMCEAGFLIWDLEVSSSVTASRDMAIHNKLSILQSLQLGLAAPGYQTKLRTGQ